MELGLAAWERKAHGRHEAGGGHKPWTEHRGPEGLQVAMIQPHGLSGVDFVGGWPYQELTCDMVLVIKGESGRGQIWSHSM